MNIIGLLCSLSFMALLPQQSVNGIKYPSKPKESLSTIQTFRKGYQQGVNGLFYSAISTLQEIPKSSALYPRAKKLISFYFKRYEIMRDYFKRCEATLRNVSPVAPCATLLKC